MRTLSSSKDDLETGNRLKEIRKETKASQRDFSKLLGVSRSAYINYEQGTREVPVGVIRTLASDFNINPTWLTLGKGPRLLGTDGSKINVELLAHLEMTLLNWLNKNEKSLPSSEHARIVAICYEHFAFEEYLNDSAIELVLKMVA